MRVVQREDTFVLGLQVIAPFQQLHQRIPPLWRALFARQGELPDTGSPFVEASRELGEGRYCETLGVALPAPIEVPEGMALTHVPAGRYVHHVHEGAVEDIAAGFQAIYDWAGQQGLALGALKLDLGYTPGGTDGHHHLFIDVVG